MCAMRKKRKRERERKRACKSKQICTGEVSARYCFLIKAKDSEKWVEEGRKEGGKGSFRRVKEENYFFQKSVVQIDYVIM